MLDSVKHLAKAGFALHWLRPRSKAPFTEAWSQEPVYSLTDLNDSYTVGHNVGVRLGEPSRIGGLYLHAFDLDIRKVEFETEAVAALRQIAPNFDTYPTVQSGSGGSSRHFYFLSDKPFRSRKLAHSQGSFVDDAGKKHWNFEIELFGTGKQIVLPPSIHPTGKPYRWLREFDFEEIEEYGLGPIIGSATVEAWGAAPAIASGDDDEFDLIDIVKMEPLDLTDDEVRDTLNLLPLDEWCEDRDGWLKVGMALHHQFRGDESGYRQWCEFSKRSAKFDSKVQRATWDSFRLTPKGVRFATLLEATKGARAARLRDLNGPGGDIYWGRRLAAHFNGQFLHVLPGGGWRRWDGMHWAPCNRGEEVEAAKAFAGAMLAETSAAYAKSETDQAKKLHADSLTLFKAGRRLKSTLDMSATDPLIVVSPDQFDRDPLRLAVPNGVLCLASGQLIEPTAAMLISRQSRATFDPLAKAPLWERFLERVQPDREIREFIQRAVGYTLTGSVDEEKLFFLHGTGANGKSVFAAVIRALLGDFAVTVGSKLLTKSYSTSEADRLVSLLPGARLALANETAQGDVWDDQRVKELAARDPISARELYKSAFSFTPTHKLFILGNHLPGAHDAGDGFWRRLIPIPFPVTVPPADRIADLERRIVEGELSGVLNWALSGCREWQAGGLDVPQQIRRAIDRYRADTDILGLWLSECVDREPTAWLPISEAFESYCSFCRDQNVKPPPMMGFSRQMTSRGLGTAGSRKRGRQIPGIKLRSFGFEAFEDIG